MDTNRHSRTAGGAAGFRAAHQLVEGGAIFADPFARAILDAETLAEADLRAADPATRPTRMFMAVRSRYAEDALAGAVGRGVRQAVVLGAGLDTLALRNPHRAAGLRLFEVDHPATQAWKRERLAAAELALPDLLSFVPIDFERQALGQGLAAAGFRDDLPAFFIWLGVVPYLARPAIERVLAFVASIPRGEIVFDYSEPLDSYPPERRAGVAALGARAAAAGEPWLSHFNPAELHDLARRLGLALVEDLGVAGVAVRFFGVPEHAAPAGAGPHVVHLAQA
ncbi:Putative S-adenosyl-L-methionine-dependent methyltransferase [bacterium YEK0313]|nr:Putative S-adenosyl-L-methionine-dependent methyltransferase [bacterium YEK0313]